MNTKNSDDKFFQYAITVVLTHISCTNHTPTIKKLPHMQSKNFTMMTTKSILRFKTPVITQVNAEVKQISLCILRYKAPKEVPIVLHNGTDYDYPFIIRE